METVERPRAIWSPDKQTRSEVLELLEKRAKENLLGRNGLQQFGIVMLGIIVAKISENLVETFCANRFLLPQA